MKRIMTLISLNVCILFAANDTNYLGTLTIDNYPIKNCEIIKIGNLYSFEKNGYYHQSKSLKEKGFLNDISDLELRTSLEKTAMKDGYNAILGYKFYVNGAFDTFQDKSINGNIAFGVYNVTAQGTPVLIKCK